jgi:hypothetical protein
MFSHYCFPELDGRETPFIALLDVVQTAILVAFQREFSASIRLGRLPENELDAEAKMPIGAPTLPRSRVTGTFGCTMRNRVGTWRVRRAPLMGQRFLAASPPELTRRACRVQVRIKRNDSFQFEFAAPRT